MDGLLILERPYIIGGREPEGSLASPTLATQTRPNYTFASCEELGSLGNFGRW